MELERVITYKVPFHSKGITWCGILLGLAVFSRCLHYFGPCDFSNWNLGTYIFGIFLTIVLCCSYAILVKLVYLRSPGVYGILAASICLTILLGDVVTGKILLIIISALTMPLLGVLLLATFGGYIPFRSISSFALMIVCILRLIFWCICNIAWWVIVSDIAILSGLLCFTVSLKPCEN